MIKRRVHKFHMSSGNYGQKKELQDRLDTELAPAERIVGTHYIDGSWWIITESFGLGLTTKP